MEQEFQRDIRKEKEMVPPVAPEPEVVPDEKSTGDLETTLQASIVPGTSPTHAAEVLGHLPPEQQQQGLVWLSRHLGGLYAASVAEHLGAAEGPSINEQLLGLGDSVINAASKRSGEVAKPQGLGGESLKTAPAAPGKAGKETLLTHTDPLLGEFQVLFDVDQGLSTIADAKSVRIFSASGITLKTPGSIPPVTIYSVTLDLASGAVDIKSQPDIGPFEEKIVSGILKQTVLKGMDKARGSIVDEQMAAMPKTADGGIKLFESFAADVILDPSTQVTARLAADSLWVNFSKSILVDLLGPVNLHVRALQYNFATASVSIIPEGSGSLVKVALEQAVASIGGILGEKFIKTKLPAAMQVAGYDPARDPNLQQNLQSLIGNFAGVEKQEVGPKPDPLQKQKDPTHDQPKEKLPEPTGGDEGWQVIYKVENTKMGPISIAMDRGDQLSIDKHGTQVNIGSNNGLFAVVPGADWARELRILKVGLDVETGKLDITASQEIGEAVRGALEGLVRDVVLPKVPGEVKASMGGAGGEEMKADLPEDVELLYAVPVKGLGTARITAARGDSVKLTKNEEAIELSAAQGLRIQVVGADWIPEARIGRVRYDLKTGAIQIDPVKGAADIGPLTETIPEALVLSELVSKLPGDVKKGVGIGEQEGQKVEPTQGNVIVSQALGALGQLDLSLTDGDTIGFKYGQGGIELHIAHGLLARIPQKNLQIRLFDLVFDPKTNQLNMRTEPPLGAYEQALISGAFAQFAMPKIQEFMGKQDQELGDKHTVLYNAEMGGFGNLQLCVEAGDALSVEETAKAITVSASKGIYWLSQGQARDILPSNRIRNIRFDLETGEITVDADQDVGPLVEMVATRIVHLMVLPKLSPELRTKIFGGKDPARTDLAEDVPEPGGTMLYQGEAGGMAFDVSLDSGKFGVESLPNGLVHFNAAGKGVLLRVPKLGMGIYLWDLMIDPKDMKIHSLNTSPKAGPAEIGIIEKAAAHFAGPLISQYTSDQSTAETDSPDRLVAAAGAVELRVGRGDALSIEHLETETVISSAGGIKLRSPMLSGDLPDILAIHYQHGTGEITIDLVDHAGGSVSAGQKEVGGFTQAVLSQLTRQLLDPHLTDGLRNLGLAGKEASPPPQEVQTPKTVPWLDLQAGPLGRVQLFTDADEQVSIHATTKSFEVNSKNGVQLVLPDLGLTDRFRFLRYDFETEAVEVDGLGQLETSVVQALASNMLRSLMPGDKKGGEKKEQGPVSQTIAGLPSKDNSIVIEVDKLTIYVPLNARTDVTVSGNQLLVSFDPPIFIDGPAFGNFNFREVSYAFGTGAIGLNLKGSNILAGLFNGLARDKASEALKKLIEEKLPAEMRVPGYDLVNDPNRPAHLAQLIAGFAKK